MSNSFKRIFSDSPDLKINITDDLIKNLLSYCAMFETKNRHGEALNTPTLGVVPIYFTGTDRSILFALTQVDEVVLQELIDTLPGIDPSWNVARDPYNHLVMWLSYLIANSKLSTKQIELGITTLYKLLHYKFFTSIVYNSYRHGADADVMESVINSLSNKFDVIKEGTWKKVIEKRSIDIYSPTSIHLNTIQTYTEDDDLLYILSDIQTRLRQKIKIVTAAYYEAKEQGNKIASYNVVDSVDGEKIITAQSNVFDTMLESMSSQVQTSSRFVDNELIKVLCTKFQYVSEEMLRSVLVMLCDTASIQVNSGEFQKQKKNKQNEVLYVGIGLLMRELIQKTYRLCILDKINLSSKTSILLKAINIYTSSRTADEDILTIKRSLLYFVEGCKKSSRDATNASLSICVLLYIVIKSFDHLP